MSELETLHVIKNSLKYSKNYVTDYKYPVGCEGRRTELLSELNEATEYVNNKIKEFKTTLK